MEKTIEERAFASWKERYPEGSELYKDAQIDGYIRGATEQKAIDDEEQGKELLYAVHKTAERTKREMIEKACKEFCCCCMRENDRSCVCLDSSKCRLYLDFKKAMEE